jgi:hypothetical protein
MTGKRKHWLPDDVGCFLLVLMECRKQTATKYWSVASRAKVLAAELALWCSPAQRLFTNKKNQTKML